jgi:diadenosine tetraphosphate (Ap4A) HIT family hydrolase
MLVDPHVHFHVIPRYEGTRTGAGLTIADAAWGKPPALADAYALQAAERDALRDWVKGGWPRSVG